MIKYDKTKWVDGTTVLRASHMEKIEKGITDIIDYNNSIYTDEDTRKSNEKQRQEEHSRKMNEVSEVVSDIQKDYDSLQKIIIDENASANLQNQIDQTNSQLAHKASKNEIFSMANMGQDIKEAMTGGSVAVVGKDMILTENIVDGQVTGRKISDGSITESKLSEIGKMYNMIGNLDFEFSDNYITTNGVLKPMEGWYVTYPISIEHMPIEVVVDASGYVPGIWVDDSNNYTEDISKNISDNNDGTYTITFGYPLKSSSKYLRINHNDNNITSIKLSSNGCINTNHLKPGIITREKLSKDFKITNEIISDNSITGDKLIKAGCEIDMTDYPVEHIGNYIDNYGQLQPLQNWKVTYPIDISNTSYIIYKSSQKPAILGCFFDINNSYIKGVNYSVEEQDDIYITTINCNNPIYKYIRLNIWDKTISISKTTSGGDIDSIHLKNGCITHDKLSTEVRYMINKINNINRYTDLHYTRNCISDFLDKWQNKEMVNVVCLGDSITNFQNSEILDLESQKNAPLGLQGNSWVRRLWKILNYDVYNDDRTIKNENGNLGYKRYDHDDFNFEGGYQGTSDSVGNYKWATNRSDSQDAWRNVNYAGYSQIITTESTSNKMMIGSNIVGATCSVTIPSNAIGMAVVFGGCSCVVNIKVNDGTSNIIDTNVTLNGEAYELHKEFSLNTGTNKTITITLISGVVWLYGVEYWSANCVRVINSGLAGNSVGSLVTNFDKLTKGFNGSLDNVDLVVWEVNALNDARELLTTTRKNANSVFSKITDLGIPILAIMTHRHQKGQVTLQYDRYNPIYDSSFPSGSKFVGYRYFYPDYIRLYKTLSYKYKAGIIDIYSKSVDICGGLSNTEATFPDNFFNDGIHLGIVGNECYEEELKKVFMWEDYE